jgi:hypothetical protein
MSKIKKILLTTQGTILSEKEQSKILGGFKCYCNGIYLGEFNDMDDCWNMCP